METVPISRRYHHLGASLSLFSPPGGLLFVMDLEIKYIIPNHKSKQKRKI